MNKPPNPGIKTPGFPFWWALGLVLFLTLATLVFYAVIQTTATQDKFEDDCRRDGYFIDESYYEYNCVDADGRLIRQFSG